MRRTRISLLLVLGMLAALLPMGATGPAAATTGDLVITGVVDGPLTGGTPKAVEFLVVNSIADLSVYGFGSANNGGGTDGQEFTFPAVSAAAGTFIYVASEDVQFNNFFGFAPDYTSSAANINGDDAIELFSSGVVVDVFGDINVDGSGKPWDHLDGWAYRVDGTGRDGATFVLANWYFSGVDALDGESTNGSAITPFPIGSYIATVVDEPPTVGSTSPANGDTNVALDANVEIAFSEDVTVADPWFEISCDSGARTAAVSGGPTIFTLDPSTDFTNDEGCTVTVFAASVTDTDGVADEMAVDFSFSFTVVGTATTPATVVINEVDYDQPSTDTAEFVELKNIGTTTADLDLFSLEVINGSGGGATVATTIDLPDVSLAAGDYFVVCANAATVANCDLDVSPDSNLIQNGAPDAVGLLLDDVLVDAVSYEGDTGAPYIEGSGVGLEDPGTAGSDALSISRTPDGVDTDQNNVDFSTRCSTPGAANSEDATDCLPPVVVINEVDYDQPSTDTAEFVELKNIGTTTADLDLFSLEVINGSGGGATVATTIDLPDVSLAAGDYFVVCANAATVANCDLDVSPDSNLIQNGAPDAVGLLLDDVLVDAVSYEGDTGAPYIEGSGVGLEDPGTAGSDALSISRTPDGVDTDQNNVDFSTRCSTPGAANSEDATDCLPPVDACGDPATFISAIQGNGATSPEVGNTHSVEAVIVADAPGLRGFYIQEEPDDVDADPATSEGIFVYLGGDYASPGPIGNLVRVRGEVGEYTTSSGTTFQTQIYGPSTTDCGAATPIDATDVILPISTLDEFERYEGMLVRFPQTLAVSDYWNFDRFNETMLALPIGGQDRPFQGTAVAEPGAPSQAVTDLNVRSRITLDDGRTTQNSDPAIHPNGSDFSLSNLFRGGDTVVNATGVIDNTFGIYRIQPTIWPEYDSTNPRSIAPDNVGGTMTVAAFNVLNYFTTFGSRGADNQIEFTRQRDKIFAALSTIDADVVGLIEIENNGSEAAGDLVAGLNAVVGADTYDFIDTGVIGDDAIAVALIYKPDSVSAIGGFQVLDDPSFTDPNNLGVSKNRPALAQTFADNASGEVFTVVVNHLKSKGSGCGEGDDDPQQGSCNDTRTKAAQVLVDWLASDPTGSNDSDFLIIGDLNAYDEEDPIDAVRAGADDALGTGDDYTDLVKLFGGEFAYSYLFGAQFGYLDHALASRSAARHVSGTTVWHINADEPDILDYNTNFRTENQINNLYQPDAYRSSDHDPVIVGLDFSPRALKRVTIDELAELLPTGSWYYDWWIKKAIKSIEYSLNPAYWVDDFHLTDKGKKVFDKERWAVRVLMWVHGSVEPEVDAVIAALVRIDEELASIAIAEATAAGGSEWYLKRAEREMKRAQYDRDRGRPDKAINHYKKAWEYAGRSLGSHWWHCGR